MGQHVPPQGAGWAEEGGGGSALVKGREPPPAQPSTVLSRVTLMAIRDVVY